MDATPATRIGQFRAVFGDELSRKDHLLLHRLQTDERMADAWLAIERRMQAPHGYSTLFSVIVGAKRSADGADDFPQSRAHVTEYMKSLREAARLLRNHFDDGFVPNNQSAMAPSCRPYAEGLANCREAVASIEKHLSWQADIFKSGLAGFDEFFNSRQNKPSTVFGNMIGDYLNEAFGSPLHGFVATLTNVAFKTDPDRPLSGSSVAVNWGKHRKRLSRNAFGMTA